MYRMKYFDEGNYNAKSVAVFERKHDLWHVISSGSVVISISVIMLIYVSSRVGKFAFTCEIISPIRDV